MKRWKTILCSMLVMALLITPIASTARAATFPDVPGHWAEPAIVRWTNYEVVNGYSDGSFHPNDLVTRGQMATILYRVFGWTTRASNTFVDLRGNEWYADAILRAKAVGIMEGDGQKVYPQAPISREDAAVMLARALQLAGSETALDFPDQADIHSWARPAVSAMTQKGYIVGAPDGNFYPLNSITRGELLTILDRAITNYYNKAGTYSGSLSGNTVVAASGVILQGVSVGGDLIIAQGATEGNVTLENVTVAGRTLVQSGSTTQVNITGSSQAGDMVVSGNGARVTIVDPAKVDTVTITGSGASVSGLPQNMNVTVDANAQNVVVNGHAVAPGTTTQAGANQPSNPNPSPSPSPDPSPNPSPSPSPDPSPNPSPSPSPGPGNNPGSGDLGIEIKPIP